MTATEKLAHKRLTLLQLAERQELRALQRELQRVKEERDILKKALAYFAEDQK